ncbi:tail fiber protein [Xenorhabdus sp. ZM]|nr:tail fiber protein [Xenorhabdus sp. ZM]
MQGYAVDINATRVLTIYPDGTAVPASYANFDARYANIPVGIPIPWPLSKPPSGYIECRGQAFPADKYPLLALAYPSGLLPDLRGEFIRGWDNGRGIDSGREILSFQQDLIGRHSHQITPYTANKAFSSAPAYATPDTLGGGGGALDSGSTGGDETRPRNIAFLYIVRAV